eukprot:1160513-Pelagomonas_calceolata.AAC.1
MGVPGLCQSGHVPTEVGRAYIAKVCALSADHIVHCGRAAFSKSLLHRGGVRVQSKSVCPQC